MQLVLTILVALLAIVLIAMITLQSGKSSGLSSAVSGASESFFSKNKNGSLDATLAKLTKWVALAFVVLTFVLNLF